MALATLDASIVVGLLDAGDAHHAKAWSVIEELDAHLVLPVSAFSEILVGVLRSGPSSAKVFDVFCQHMVRRIEPITETVARRAAGLRFRHPALRLPDALVIATGEELDSDAILTADRRWRRVSKRVRVV